MPAALSLVRVRALCFLRALVLPPLFLSACLPALVLPAMLAPSGAVAQEFSPEFEAAYGNAILLYRQGAYDEAVPFAEQALILARRELDPTGPDLATVLNDLAALYSIVGRLAEAEPLYMESLAIRRQALGPLHPYVATSLINLAELLYRTDRPGESVVLLRVAIAIFEYGLGPNGAPLIRPLESLASLYEELGQPDAAEALFRRALTITERVGGANHREVAVRLDNLAGHMERRNRMVEAEALYRRALDIRREVLANDSYFLATSLNHVARMAILRAADAEAETLQKQALSIWETLLGPDHPAVAVALNNLAALYAGQGRFSLAEPLYRRSLAIRRAVLGEHHPDTADSLNNLAYMYRRMERFADAETLYQEALHIRRSAFGGMHPKVAESLNNLAALYQVQERFDRAGALYRESLSIRLAVLGDAHPEVAIVVNNLAIVLAAQGDYRQAEDLYRRALAILETSVGADAPEVALLLNNLAQLLQRQFRLEEAQAVLERALAIQQRQFGSLPLATADTLSNLAAILESRGLPDQAEGHFRRALAIREQALGADHLLVVDALTSLAGLLLRQQRWIEAQALNGRGLDILRRVLGPGHERLADMHLLVAAQAITQGRLEEAETHLRRRLVLLEAAHGKDHRGLVPALADLARDLEAMGRLDEAEGLRRRVVAILEAGAKPDDAVRSPDPALAAALFHLATVRGRQGHPHEALALHERALALREAALGDDHWTLVASHLALSPLYAAVDRRVMAEIMLKRARRVVQNGFGADHWRLAGILAQLALARDRLGDWRGAMAAAATAADILDAQPFHRHAGAVSTRRRVYEIQAALASRLTPADPAMAETLRGNGFLAVQKAQLAASATAREANYRRLHGRDGALAAWIADRRRILESRLQMDRMLEDLLEHPPGQRDLAIEARLRQRLRESAIEWRRLAAIANGKFPDFAALAAPRPLPLDEARSVLAADEALLVYGVTENQTVLWVVRAHGASVHHIDLGRDALSKAVGQLRKALDPRLNPVFSDLPVFDSRLAHDLYRQLVEPAMPMLDGARRVMLVTDGPLGGLPFAALVHRDVEGGVADYTDYAAIGWLGDLFTLSRLPAVASLRQRQGSDTETPATGPLLGIADPALSGRPDGQPLAAARLYAGGMVADVAAVRDLPPLPPMASELARLDPKAGKARLIVGRSANERVVKMADLATARVVAFGTHILIGGPFTGPMEPALVMTPPKEGSTADDGLLGASEIAALRLNADWVVLTGGDTVAADGSPSADGLAVLARAFRHAGARAVAMSHWPPPAEVTQRLLRDALAASDPGAGSPLGRAEALRRAMQRLRQDPDNPHYAHPMFWAPFVVVGEGAR